MSSPSGFNNTVQQYAPWRRGIAWWVVLIQGLVLLAIGGYALWNTTSASKVIVLGIGIYLVATAVWTVVQAMRGRDVGLSVFGLLAAGGGLVAGISVALPYLFGRSEALGASFFTFGIALITIGILTLFAAFVERPEAGIAWTSMVRGLVWALLGAYLVYAVATNIENSLIVRWIAIALVVLGALLAIYSILLNRQQVAKKPKLVVPDAAK